MKRVLRYLSNSLLVFLALSSLLLLYSNSQGRKSFVVLSGSMAPAYPVGSLVVTKGVTSTDLQVGDVITFRTEGEAKTVVTHRITGRNLAGTEFQTQGDANDHPDGQGVSSHQVIGKVVAGVPALGYLITVFQQPLSQFGIMMGLILYLMTQVRHYFFKPDKSKERTALDGRG